MSDAPKEIWLDWRPGAAVTQGLLASPPRTCYVHGDLYEAVKAENERLRGAVNALLDCPHIADRDVAPWHEPDTEAAVDRARAALKGETP